MGNFQDSLFESLLVSAGRLSAAADFADELQSGGMDVFVGNRNIGLTQDFDAPAHILNCTNPSWRDRQAACSTMSAEYQNG